MDPSSIPEDYKYHNPHMRQRPTQIGHGIEVAPGDTNPETMLDNGTFCGGDPDACIRTAEKYESQGIDQFLPLFQAGNIPHDKIMSSIRLFGKYVIPHFQEKAKKEAKAAKPA